MKFSSLLWTLGAMPSGVQIRGTLLYFKKKILSQAENLNVTEASQTIYELKMKMLWSR